MFDAMIVIVFVALGWQVKTSPATCVPFELTVALHLETVTPAIVIVVVDCEFAAIEPKLNATDDCMVLAGYPFNVLAEKVPSIIFD